MIEKYCNFEVTAMKILVKSNQRYYDNCELLDCKMVGLGGLEPPTSPLSEGCSYADNPYSKAFLRVWEIKFPDSSHPNLV